ncbi:MAG: hypothetical protein V4488_20255 [Pseudomonadota bacterium]
MKILISILLACASSVASAGVMNICIDAEGKKVSTELPCEQLSLKDMSTPAAPVVQPDPGKALPFQGPPLPDKVAPGPGKIRTPPPVSPWLEFLRTEYSLLLLLGIVLCPMFFALFWYVFEYRTRRN